jgi:hypothetical protein
MPLLQQRVSRSIQLLREIVGPASVRMDPFYQALIRCVNLLVVRSLSQSEDFERLSGADVPERLIAQAIVLLLPSLPFSLGSFPLSVPLLLPSPFLLPRSRLALALLLFARALFVLFLSSLPLSFLFLSLLPLLRGTLIDGSLSLGSISMVTMASPGSPPACPSRPKPRSLS